MAIRGFVLEMEYEPPSAITSLRGRLRQQRDDPRGQGLALKKGTEEPPCQNHIMQLDTLSIRKAVCDGQAARTPLKPVPLRALRPPFPLARASRSRSDRPADGLAGAFG